MCPCLNQSVSLKEGMYKAAHLYWEQGIIIPQMTMVTTIGRKELHAEEANKNGYYKYEVLSVKN